MKNLFDNFLIGFFSAVFCQLTGLVISAFSLGFGATTVLIGPIFYVFSVLSVVVFILGLLGKEKLVIDVLSVPWKLINGMTK